MSGPADIQYICHREIDKKKWDQCIEESDNSLIYGFSYYLDIMSAKWDALVWGNYKMVMPLTWNRKYGIHYLYQPFLTAQLGIFGQQINSQMVEAFIRAIPVSFRLVEISLNSANHPVKHKNITERNNYTLELNRPYDEIYEGYNENTRRNIKKSKQSGCRVITGFDVEKLISLAIGQMKNYKEESGDNVKRFRKLYEHLHHNNSAYTYGIVSKEEELIASSVFFISNKRAYYILVGNHPDSKTKGASHALVDGFIRDHAGKLEILDFEGSDMPNLAFFYSGFGAVNEKYPFLKINRLPFYLRWMKK